MSPVCDRHFEIYKLHTELAERVASLREDVSKVHSGIVAGIVAAAVLFHKLMPSLSDDGASFLDWIWVFPSLGSVISLSWVLSILSITKRLEAKYEVLREFECKLKINFLGREQQEFRRRQSFRRQFSALLLPGFSFALCVIWLIRLICTV